MIRRKTGLKVLLLTNLSLWMVGCQQTAPLGLGQRYNNQFFSQQQTQTPTDYSNLFNNINKTQSSQTQNSTTTAAPPVAANCARYTRPAQNMIDACNTIITQYAGDLADIAPNCYSAFKAITPNTACSTLVPQLNTVIQACNDIFTNPTYSSIVLPNCSSAVQVLKSS